MRWKHLISPAKLTSQFLTVYLVTVHLIFTIKDLLLPWITDQFSVEQSRNFVHRRLVIWKGLLTHWGQDKMDVILQTTFSRAFSEMNVWIPIKISLKFVPKGTINNIPALVYIMAWHRSGDKPLSEPMVVNILTLICIPRPQWVNSSGAEAKIFWVHWPVQWLLMPWLLMSPGHQQSWEW